MITLIWPIAASQPLKSHHVHAWPPAFCSPWARRPGLAGAALARRLATPGVTINIGLGHAPAIQPHAQPGLAI